MCNTVGETNVGSPSPLASNPMANSVVDAVDGVFVSTVIITAGTEIVKEMKRKAVSDNETFMFFFFFLILARKRVRQMIYMCDVCV